MSFSRTLDGLSNLRLFYGVDAVVIVEGTPIGDEHNPASLDVMFWSKLFERYLPDLRVHMVPGGSKSEILPIASDVARNLIEGVIVAMDRDYDFECGLAFRHSRVLYSWGYSWENDVWHLDAVIRIIEDYIPVQVLPNVEKNLIQAAYGSFMSSGRRLVVSNLAARNTSNEAVIPSVEQLGLLMLTKGSYPKFDRMFFIQKLSAYNRQKAKYSVAPAVQIDPQRHIYGHLHARFCAHVVLAAVSRLASRVSANLEMLSAIAIKDFCSSTLAEQNDRSNYYSKMFAQVVVT